MLVSSIGYLHKGMVVSKNGAQHPKKQTGTVTNQGLNDTNVFSAPRKILHKIISVLSFSGKSINQKSLNLLG